MGLLEFEQTVRENTTLSLRAFTFTRSGWSGTGSKETPRIVLPERRLDWPAPAGRSSCYVGVWQSGSLTNPDGAEEVNGPAWRRR